MRPAIANAKLDKVVKILEDLSDYPTVSEAANEVNTETNFSRIRDIDTPKNRESGPSINDRLESVERAAGIGDRQPKKGIAQRLDSIEETQEEILARLDKLESD